jgi:MFS family permease
MVENLKTPHHLLSRPFILISVATFLGAHAPYMLAILPRHLRVLGLDESRIGAVMGAFSLASLVVMLFVARLSDRYGRRLPIVAGMLLLAASCAAVEFCTTFPLLVAARIGCGAGWAALLVGGSLVVTEVAPPGRLAQALGVSGILNLLAMALGPTVGEIIVAHASFAWLFRAGAAVALVGVLCALLLPAWPAGHPKASRPRGFGLVLDRIVLPLLGATFLVALGFGGIIHFLADMTSLRHLGAVAQFFDSYVPAAILARLTCGGMSDKLGRRAVIVPSFVMQELALVGLALADAGWQLLLVGAAYGFSHGLYSPRCRRSPSSGPRPSTGRAPSPASTSPSPRAWRRRRSSTASSHNTAATGRSTFSAGWRRSCRSPRWARSAPGRRWRARSSDPGWPGHPTCHLHATKRDHYRPASCLTQSAMKLPLLFAALALGCGAADATGDDHENTAKADSYDRAAAPPLRLLTGDVTRIADDWTASEGGAHFAIVTDGTPAKPWISTAHAFGARSLAFKVPTDMSGHKQRVEYKVLPADDADGLHFDNARYAGFAFKLEAAPAPFLGSAIFWQAWQGYPWGPPVALKIAKGAAPPYRVRLTVRNPATGPESTDPDLEIWSGAVLQPDVWRTFVIYVRPRFGGGGEVKLWIDGTKVVDWTGAIGYDPSRVAGASAGLDLKNGIYQPDANNGHTFHFDEIVVADSYAAAAAQLGW